MRERTLTTDFFPSRAGPTKGRAALAALAPRAIDLAISTPVLTPPVAIIGRETLDSIMLATVGIPKSQKSSPRCSEAESPLSLAL